MKSAQIKVYDDFPKQLTGLKNIAYDIRISRVFSSPSCETFSPYPTLRKTRLFFETTKEIPRVKVLAKRYNLRMFRPVDIVPVPPAVTRNASTGVA